MKTRNVSFYQVIFRYQSPSWMSEFEIPVLLFGHWWPSSVCYFLNRPVHRIRIVSLSFATCDKNENPTITQWRWWCLYWLVLELMDSSAGDLIVTYDSKVLFTCKKAYLLGLNTYLSQLEGDDTNKQYEEKNSPRFFFICCGLTLKSSGQWCSIISEKGKPIPATFLLGSFDKWSNHSITVIIKPVPPTFQRMDLTIQHRVRAFEWHRASR